MGKLTVMEEARQQNKSGIVQGVLVTLLVVASFAIGSLYTKVQYLERGTKGNAAQPTAQEQAAQPASKYASFDDAMKALAKQAKVDDKKLLLCMNSGEKKSVMENDTTEGSNLGVSGTPAFFINGKFLGGAFPYELFKEIIDKEVEGKGSTDYKDYSQRLQDAYLDPRGKSFDPMPKNVTVGTAPTKGGSAAKVTILEYSDFQCPYCAAVFPTVQQILRDYRDNVQFAYKHFPLTSIHKRAQKAAEASECAKDQGKFWEFHDALFESQKDWSSL